MLEKSRLRHVFWIICAAFLFAWAFAPGNGQWHAEQRIDDLDCSDPEVCRYRGHLDKTEFDAAGRPYHFVTNSLGFRGKDFPAARPDPSVVRVEIFGDSLVFGIGAPEEDTLSEALRKALQEKLPGKRIEVLNFGLPCNYTISNLRTYAKYGRRYRPDAIIFGQPRILARDINSRINEIKSSPFFSFLRGSSLGRWFINYYQSKILFLTWPSAKVDVHLKSEFQQVLDDQRETGMDVWFLKFFEDQPSWLPLFFDIRRAIPDGLRYGMMGSGLTVKAYRESPYQLPGDGHPNAAGRRLFARIMADSILPGLLRKTARMEAARH